MSNENEKYFLVADLGYDGLDIIEFNSENEALGQYTKDEFEVISRSHPNAAYNGVALIKGKIIKCKKLRFDRKML